jgi:putative transposase
MVSPRYADHLWSMPRHRRVHAPGHIFHITARVQGKAALFTPELRTTIADFIFDATIGSSVRLLAFVVMSNHLHLIVRQGRDPLGWFVQRVLQRAALLVRRTFSHHGHVFGRSYWAGLCDHPAYVRQAIIYTHLNPCYARMCAHPDVYPWSSHLVYREPLRTKAVDARHALRFFGSADCSDPDCWTNYCAFLEYWLKRDRLPLGAMHIYRDDELALAPTALAGDAFWTTEYGDVAQPPPRITQLIDIRDRAAYVLRRLAMGISLADLRAAGRVRALCFYRRNVIATLYADGYANGAIARCLNVSHAHVSAVAAGLRTRTAATESEAGLEVRPFVTD